MSTSDKTFDSPSAGSKIRDVSFTDDAMKVDLLDGRSITVPLIWYPRLWKASPAQREQWSIAGGGFGIHWAELDEDLSVEGLLRGAPAVKRSSPAA